MFVKKASRHRAEKKRTANEREWTLIRKRRRGRGKHPQITQITQIFLRGILREKKEDEFFYTENTEKKLMSRVYMDEQEG